MAEWRFLRGWSPAALRQRVDRLPALARNFGAVETEMHAGTGWHHYHSDATIARGPESAMLFTRAKTALATYQFSNPRIVTAHFEPDRPLLGRRMLLEIRVFGLHYLCPAVVAQVVDEDGRFGYRYDTLEGHVERGMEWFVLTQDPSGDIRFRIEARWQRGEFPNWWSRLGFVLLAGHYQRRWHREAHQRMSLLAHFGSPWRPARDAAGLTHQGVDVVFTYYNEKQEPVT